MKYLKLFEESKVVKSAKVMTPEEIDDTVALQNHNQEKFKDIFELMDKIMTYDFANESEKNGSIKTIQMLRSHLLHRKVD